MARAFSFDFSRVRIHTGPAADEVASASHAHALTAGTDVLFRSGAYRPATPAGQRLIAHELAHVVQQAHGLARAALDGGTSDPLEQAADRAADEALEQVTAAHSIQRKPTVGARDDSLERAADDVADQVMFMPESPDPGPVPVAAQRACVPCGGGQTKRIQAKHSAAADPAITVDTDAAVRAAAGGGVPLPAEVRSYFEPRFGLDFSRVRIHSDTSAADGARAVRAQAYTIGHDIVFGAGQYRPETLGGKRLLAHELAHVVQQSRLKSPPSIQRYGHHSSCTDPDLKGVVWPGDHAMREMVTKAIRVVSASPIDPKVKALFPKYFMTATPKVAEILDVFNKVQAVISGDAYMYECEHECGPEEAASVRHRLRYVGINPNIHLCINHMGGYSLQCNASLILHEMLHYAAHLDDEAVECGACSTSGCPASLTPEDALDNTYSYADFAFELYPMKV